MLLCFPFLRSSFLVFFPSPLFCLPHICFSFVFWTLFSFCLPIPSLFFLFVLFSSPFLFLQLSCLMSFSLLLLVCFKLVFLLSSQSYFLSLFQYLLYFFICVPFSSPFFLFHLSWLFSVFSLPFILSASYLLLFCLLIPIFPPCSVFFSILSLRT